MSLAWRLGGAGIAILGIIIMTLTIWVTGSGTLEIGNNMTMKVPTQADLNARTPYFVVGASVMFIGFGVIWIGRRFCISSN